MQFGLDSFGDVTVDAAGDRVPYPQVIRNVVDQAVLADRLGVDAFGLGEHHRDDFAVSAPEIVLAAIAGRTERITLGTAVTVLSSDDPVRVYERFATLDAVSGGQVYPKTATGRIPTWIGVGGSPESVVRAARYGLPMVLAIIGGDPARFRPYVDLFHRAPAEFAPPDAGTEPLPVAVHSPGFVAATDEEAVDILWPHARRMTDRIGRERGWPPLTRARFENDVAEGAWHVGSPETVAQKIARTVRVLGVQRFDLKYSTGTLPHEHLMACVRRYGEEVIPRVRELLD